jgi:hypothetical protein
MISTTPADIRIHFYNQGFTASSVLVGRVLKIILAPGAFACTTSGTVYLCHPFLVHAAQPNHGSKPRFLAQPPLLLNSDFNIAGPGPFSPVEDAIRTALAG